MVVMLHNGHKYTKWIGEKGVFNFTNNRVTPTEDDLTLTPTAILSLDAKDGNIRLTPEGDVAIHKWLLLSDYQQERIPLNHHGKYHSIM